jgi:predicted membrane-bound spermidine synthase
MGVHLVFFVSGFAALVYQVVWQRSLFALYGITSEAVSVVVTAFMLGLGLGSWAGGRLSRTAWRPLALFGVVELAIGAFGAGSLALFRSVGAATLLWPPPAVAGVTFLLLLVPTLLMGATLPLLTSHLVRRSGNVGRSLGALYFSNTLGSAASAAVSALVLLGALGQSGTVRLASTLNVAVGTAALAMAWRERRAPAPEAPSLRGAA